MKLKILNRLAILENKGKIKLLVAESAVRLWHPCGYQDDMNAISLDI